MARKMCLKQWIRPGIYTPPVPGEGDCRTCVPGKRNKECIGYCEITIDDFEIVE